MTSCPVERIKNKIKFILYFRHLFVTLQQKMRIWM